MYISVRVSPLYACVKAGNGSHTVSLTYVMGHEKGGSLEIHVLCFIIFFFKIAQKTFGLWKILLCTDRSFKFL